MAATVDPHNHHQHRRKHQPDEHPPYRPRPHHRTDYDDGIGIESSSESENEEISQRAPQKTDKNDHAPGLIEPDGGVRMWDRFKRLSGILNRGDVDPSDAAAGPGDAPQSHDPPQPTGATRPETGERRTSRKEKAIAGLPRPGTFKRQESEKREKLTPHERCAAERRVASAGAGRSASTTGAVAPTEHAGDLSRVVSATASPPTHEPPPPFSSLPPSTLMLNDETAEDEKERLGLSTTTTNATVSDVAAPHPTLNIHTDLEDGEPPPPFSPLDGYSDSGMISESIDEAQLNEELERKWILNLSMHFRDRSDREKFFITYAETPTHWRRVTVSCDYRDATPDSLELDLKGLRYQRDKNSRIYESIRESLPDIQFYDSVTNLKLQTSDGRLHVHVTEDIHEIIPYPPVSAVAHLTCPRFRESRLQFEAHMSGYVYRIAVDDHVYIKKEIPGPDSVDEFLYEINALSQLQESQSVIRFGGLIVDDDERVVKGLLISYAAQGALVDLLYDDRGHLPWPRRERWARQIVQGLSEIHEAGFVQGDFTLSNIVIDAQDDAKIIDINRRGCPVGWEPPELAPYIASNQRISMYIGVKSDLFQLGMVLWALAEEQDEPEMLPRPLTARYTHPCHDDLPAYFTDLIELCLDEQPHRRLAAKELLPRFPEIDDVASRPALKPAASPHPAANTDDDAAATSPAPPPGDKRYIDPSSAVEREDLDRFRHAGPEGAAAPVERGRDVKRAGSPTSEGVTYVDATKSIDTGYGSSPGVGTYVVPRGRTGPLHHHHNPPGTHGDAKPSSTGVTTENTPGDADADADAVSVVDAKTDADDDDDGADVQIVSISPAEGRWEEIQVEGNPYLIDRKSVEIARREDADEHADAPKVHEIGDELLPAKEASTEDHSAPSAQPTLDDPGPKGQTTAATLAP